MLTLAQAAERLGVTPDTLRQQIAAGRLHARKMGIVWVVSEQAVEKYRRDLLGRKGPHAAPHSVRSTADH
jgi:excisionase family DNA binding protein